MAGAILIRSTGMAAALLLITSAFLPMRPLVMELKIIGKSVILSGPVVGDEPGKIREALANTPDIDTAILRNSPGGNAPAGYQVGELFGKNGSRTAVSGYCYSSCSRMFLGGGTRYFTGDYMPENNNVGFHGHYDRTGHLNANLVREYGLRDWIIKFSDGKADRLLVERWINIPHSAIVRERGPALIIDACRSPPRYTICGFGQRTFAGTRGNGEVAPIPAIRPVVGDH